MNNYYKWKINEIIEGKLIRTPVSKCKIENLLKESSTNRLWETKEGFRKTIELLRIEVIVVTKLIEIEIKRGIIWEKLIHKETK